MMRWIVESSLRFRFVVVAVAIAVMVVGVQQLRQMPVDVLPEFGPPTVEVQTEALGLSASEVEQLITVPMEQDLLNGVAWLDEIRSESLPSLSRIVLIFESGTDPLRARQVVQERLTQAHALPNVSKPPVMLQPLSSTSRLMMVRLSSQEMSPIELSVLAHWTIIPRLMGVPGVANVTEWGHRERQLQVQVDPEQLQEMGVSLQQVISTTGNALWVSPLTFLQASTPGTGGFIDTPNQRLSIQHLLPIRTADDLSQVPIERSTLRLGDVATVTEDHQPLIGDAVFADGDGLLLVVEKFPEVNTLEVTRGIDTALTELQPGLTGVAVDSTVFRSASFIESAVDNLTLAVLVGALLLLLILFALLFNWRTALIAIFSISLSLVAAGFVLYLRGSTFNMLLLAGFVAALAIVVDDAIVDVDNISRRLRQRRESGDTRSAAAIILEASLEIRSAIIYATVIILVAVVPIAFLSGLTRSFSRPLVLSYALAILVSMLVALTVTPALSYFLLSRAPLRRQEGPVLGWIQRGYQSALSHTVRRWQWMFAAVGVVAALGLVVAIASDVLPERGGLPALQDRDLLIQWEGIPGTSETEMSRITANVSNELKSVPGVQSVGAHLGRAVTSDQAVNVNAGELWVSLDSNADYDATVASIRDVIAGYPGIYRDVLTYPEEQLRAEQSGSGKDLVVRLYGEDLTVLSGKAREVAQMLSGVDGVVDRQVEQQILVPQVEIQVDLDAAQEYGIKPGDVRRSATTLLSGLVVGNLFEDQKVFEVVVWGQPEARHSLTSIEELMIDTPDGEQVPLGEVADVRIAPTPNVIRHDAVRRYVDVTANVNGRSVGAVASDVRDQLDGISFPLEYHAQVLGNYAERQSAQRTLFTFGLGAAVIIFLLLQSAFGSWRLAALIFVTLPSALVGGVLAAYLGDGVLSLGSLVGLLTVLGIATRNGMMLISRYQHLERDEEMTFGPELVLRGAKERLAPILMTALATALALVPLVVSGNIPGNEIEYPIAIVVIGGLFTSTLLNLFVVPAIYLRFPATPQPVVEHEPVETGQATSPAPASD